MMNAARSTRRHRGRSRARAAFTLVELLVTLVVAGITATAAAAVVASLTDVREAVRRSGDELTSAHAARETLQAWLHAAALAAPPEPFIGVARREEPIARDELSFDVSDAGVLHPGPHRVHLWTGKSERVGEAALYAELWPRSGSREVDTMLVVPRVAGLAVRYLGRAGTRDDWRDWWSAGDTLPVVVELHLLGDRAFPLQSVLRAPLVVRVSWEGRP